MQDYPHHYLSTAEAPAEGEIRVSSPRLEDIASLAPAEFGGPGDLWSPETFLSAAVASCFILTFRAVARGARFEFNDIKCEVDAVLDRVEKVTRFTDYNIKVTLHVPAGTDLKKAERLTLRSEQICLVTNSLNGECHIENQFVIDD